MERSRPSGRLSTGPSDTHENMLIAKDSAEEGPPASSLRICRAWRPEGGLAWASPACPEAGLRGAHREGSASQAGPAREMAPLFCTDKPEPGSDRIAK